MGEGQSCRELQIDNQTGRVSEKKRASFKFAYEIRNEAKELIATGYTLHACQDPATSQLIAIPEWLKAIMPDADLDPAPPRR